MNLCAFMVTCLYAQHPEMVTSIHGIGLCIIVDLRGIYREAAYSTTMVQNFDVFCVVSLDMMLNVQPSTRWMPISH